MTRRSGRSIPQRLAALLLAWLWSAAGAAPMPASRLEVPQGFRIEVLTDAVPNARAMALGRFANGKGVIYVGSYSAGKVYAVEFDQSLLDPSRPDQHKTARVFTLASGLDLPAGVAYRDGRLYVSALSRILRFDAIDDHLERPPVPAIVTDRLPSEAHHGAKFIGFGPDARLYVAVGSPCNVCVPDAAHGLIERLNPDGGEPEVVARGVRNSVGFDWNPLDRSLWFTDNGRDMLGDDLPSDELNHVQQTGQHFGFPYCHQGDLPDPAFGAGHRCDEFTAPVAKLGAHVASLGMRFYSGNQFPADYRNNIFVAEHGSWNRSRKSGYRVVRVVLDARGRVLRQEPFVQGWLQVDAAGRETVLGRPADVLMLPDGSLLISDDLGGAIYRVRYAP
jgi:glucose/arabinose dehydrogenase